MKAIKVITIVCWVVVAATLLGLAGWFLSGTMFGLRPAWMDRNIPFSVGIVGVETLSGPFNVVGQHSADPAGINTLNVNWISGAVTITPHDGQMIEITESAQRDLHDDERMYIDVSGGTLEIRFLDRRIANRMGRMPQKRLEVLVPRALSESLNLLEVGSVSGRVSIDQMIVDHVDVGTTSGAIEITNIIAREVDLNSTSGRIEIENVTADNIGLDSTSGAMRVHASGAERMELDTLSGAISVTDASAVSLILDTTSGGVSAVGTFDSVSANSLSGAISIDNAAISSVIDARSTSGALRLSGTFHRIDAGTLSGAVTIRSIIVPASINANSTSGRISITVPDEGSITVSHSSTSGRFNSEIPVMIQNRDGQFTLSTLSGNINIYELR
ncbi:MAG: DUF4097 domain-containing protein [Oscillospiraceae bacterium]|nr:DUF4097 domain-containing protein [Oscillospiraceae bacterium]